MSTEDNKAVMARWFTDFWGPSFDPGVIGAQASPHALSPLQGGTR